MTNGDDTTTLEIVNSIKEISDSYTTSLNKIVEMYKKLSIVFIISLCVFFTIISCLASCVAMKYLDATYSYEYNVTSENVNKNENYNENK